MANVLSKVEIVGDQISHRENLFCISNDFSDLTFFEINQSVLKSSNFASKWQRSLTRDGVIAIKCLEELISTGNLNVKPGRLGIYGAFVNGPVLYSQFANLVHSDVADNFNLLKKNWPPKQHFRQNSPLKLAHLSFLFNNHGPMYCFTHPFFGIIDAIQAAEVDLFSNRVDQAIVVSAFSLEDPTQIYLYRQSGVKTCYESGVALLLERSDLLKNYSENKAASLSFDYGTCSPIIRNFQFEKGKST